MRKEMDGAWQRLRWIGHRRQATPFLPESDMSLLRPALAAGLALLFAAGPSSSLHAAPATHQVTVSKPAASLPGPRYKWVAMPAQLAEEHAPQVQDARFRADLQAALDKALQAKGYRLAEAGTTPDVIVGYRVGVRGVEETTVEDIPAGDGTPMAAFQCSGGDCSQVAVMGSQGAPVMKLETEHRTEGGLLVEVLEPGTIRVLWRALNRGTVAPGKMTSARLETIARDTLKSLPAAPKAP